MILHDSLGSCVALRARDELLSKFARRPYCTNDPGTGLVIRPLKTALDYSHIAPNPPGATAFLLFDCDHTSIPKFRYPEFWASLDLPEPTWITVNPRNGHAHVCYALKAPVCTTENGHSAPKRYLQAIQKSITKLLRADPDYNRMVTKNPFADSWPTVFTGRLFDLWELGEFVELDPLPVTTKTANLTARLDESLMYVGRNKFVFDCLRLWAYSAVRQHRQGDYQAWFQSCEAHAVEINAEMSHVRGQLKHSELKHIVKSVAKYCWTQDETARSKFSATQAKRGAANKPEVQATKGRISGLARREKSAPQRELASKLHQQGKSTAEIAAATGMTTRTIRVWTAALRAEVNNQNQISARSGVCPTNETLLNTPVACPQTGGEIRASRPGDEQTSRSAGGGEAQFFEQMTHHLRDAGEINDDD